jgi:hypothetical protein
MKRISIYFVVCGFIMLSSVGHSAESFLASVWKTDMKPLSGETYKPVPSLPVREEVVSGANASSVKPMVKPQESFSKPKNVLTVSKSTNLPQIKTLNKDVVVPVVINGEQKGSLTLKQGRQVQITKETVESYVVRLGNSVYTFAKSDNYFVASSN